MSDHNYDPAELDGIDDEEFDDNDILDDLDDEDDLDGVVVTDDDELD